MSQDIWIGKTINNRYRIESLLGKGGMSAVYRATDPNLRREVAIKLIHPHLSDNPEFVRRFEEEAAAVARLRHPNIIQIHDFDHQGDLYYIVFEYIPGETLQERLEQLSTNGERMFLAETLRIMTSMGDALAYAHEQGLVHRDIKPANIMLNKREEAILMDFGIAKISGADHHTATGMVLGTARYMSPEQVMGEQIDARTDIYALGITLFEMVNGRPPFESDSVAALMMMHVNEPVPDMQKLRPDVPPTLVTVIDKALAKDREDRYQTAAAFRSDLQQVSKVTTAGATTVESKPVAGQAGVPKSIAAVTVLEQPDLVASKTAASSTSPTSKPSNNRPLLIGGSILAFLLIAACVLSVIFMLRNNLPTSQTTALSANASVGIDPSPLSQGVANGDTNTTELNAGETAGDGSDAQAKSAPEDSDNKTAVDQLVDTVKDSSSSAGNEKAVDSSAMPDFDPLFLTSYSYDGLIVGLALPDVDTERILFSIDDPEPKIDNGRSTSGTLTIANNSIGPIPHEKGEHTLYIQYVDVHGDAGEIFSLDYKIDDIVFNFTQLPYDLETESTPAIFTMFVVDGDTDALYSYAYSVDSKALDQSVDGVAEGGVIQLQNMEPGEHILNVQATSPNDQTGIIAIPFIIE